MAHLAARPLAAMTALRADTDFPAQVARLSDSGFGPVNFFAVLQNFLEKANIGFHYLVMGSGDAVLTARNRPPTIDRKSRNSLDIRSERSMCLSAVDGTTRRCATIGDDGRGATLALKADRRAGARTIFQDDGFIELAMIGKPSIKNALNQRFGENIHAKSQQSAAIAPILHIPDGDWGERNDRGTTPNERSGR
ncbi:MAG TPA: hypothetical protein VHB27_23450 [Rhodopila sp.]|uniref:hypothetical protein n=1 Tax=Rhodopila sp. TaxID=2480087 RepID=UPI002C036109|nr:hypothetical protein [Rhodopila sp.]HVY18194.1 hypothetical protein [Rhodopila sp.]